MEQETLTKKQKEILKIVASDEKLKDFYFSGGTALSAFYLHHRLSDNLYFFKRESR